MRQIERFLDMQNEGWIELAGEFMGTVVAIYIAYELFTRVYFRQRITTLRALRKIHRLENTHDSQRKELLTRLELHLEHIAVIDKRFANVLPETIMQHIPSIIRDQLVGIEIVEPLMLSLTLGIMLIAIPKGCLVVLPITVIFPLNRIIFRKGTNCLRTGFMAVSLFRMLDSMFGIELSYEKSIPLERVEEIRSSAQLRNYQEPQKVCVGPHVDLLKFPFADAVFIK